MEYISPIKRLPNSQVYELETFDQEWKQFFPADEKYLTTFGSTTSPKRSLEDAAALLTHLSLQAKADSKLRVGEITTEGSVPVLLLYVKKEDTEEDFYLGKVYDFSDKQIERICYSFDPSSYLDGDYKESVGEGFIAK